MTIRKEDAPNAAETYERFYSFEVQVVAPPDATSASGLRPRKPNGLELLAACAIDMTIFFRMAKIVTT
jgi:hypothetical protein